LESRLQPVRSGQAERDFWDQLKPALQRIPARTRALQQIHG
jgi:hypothetical protein